MLNTQAAKRKKGGGGVTSRQLVILWYASCEILRTAVRHRPRYIIYQKTEEGDDATKQESDAFS